MPETKRYDVDPKPIEAHQIRVLLHCEELHRETNPATRATLAGQPHEKDAIVWGKVTP